MEGLTVQAQEARRNYKRQYRLANRKKINRQQREWRAANPEKVQEYQRKYWENYAKKKNIRASWKEYGLTPERVEELCGIVRQGGHNDVVVSAAHFASEMMAEYILLSIKKNLSYDAFEKMWVRGEIERIPCGKTDFYGARRLFFHYLDCALQGAETD